MIILCQVFHPDEQSTSQLLSEVLVRVAKEFRDVSVISGFPGVHRRDDLLPVREQWRGIWIERVGLRASGKKSMGLRAAAYLSYTIASTWRLVRAERGRRVLVVTNPPFLPVFAALACAIRGHGLTVLLQDIYPDGLVAVGRAKGNGVVDRIWRWANRWAFSHARELWVLGRDMGELLEMRYGVTRSRIRCVPHWSPVEFSTTRKAEGTTLYAALGLQGKFVVQYSGNMGLWHDMQSIIRAADRLRYDTRILFLLIGEGRERAPAEQLAREFGLTNVRWLPFQPKTALEDSLSCCHAALISQRAGLEGVAVPCKLYGILASGRAVVAQVPTRSEVARVVTEENCGVVVAPGDFEGLAREILRLACLPEEVTEMGRRARAAYQAKYTLEAGVRAFRAGLREEPSRTVAKPKIGFV